MSWRVLWAALTFCSVGCSHPTETQPYPGACDPFEALSWTPLPNSASVARDTAIRVAFNDYPDPDTLSATDFVLTSGVYWHTGTYAVDLLAKAAVFRAAGPLRANLGYTITVLPGVRSLAGCPATYEQRSFRTGDAPVGPVMTPPAVPFSAVQPILAASCGGAGCHRQAAEAGGGCLAGPAAGLSLCDADAYQALVGVPSRQVSRLQLVQPANAARSYLLRKLLPGTAAGAPPPTTLGHRDPPGAPLTNDQLATIAGWIDSGAVR
jgi:hypothetical protein